MSERRDAKGPKDLRETASPESRKDPRRDSYQMSMPALVSDLTRDLAALKRRVAELEKDLEHERLGRLRAEEALSLLREMQKPDEMQQPDEMATHATRELRTGRKGTVPFVSSVTPPPGGTSPRSASVPPAGKASDNHTKRIALPTSTPERKR